MKQYKKSLVSIIAELDRWKRRYNEYDKYDRITEAQDVLVGLLNHIPTDLGSEDANPPMRRTPSSGAS